MRKCIKRKKKELKRLKAKKKKAFVTIDAVIEADTNMDPLWYAREYEIFEPPPFEVMEEETPDENGIRIGAIYTGITGSWLREMNDDVDRTKTYCAWENEGYALCHVFLRITERVTVNSPTSDRAVRYRAAALLVHSLNDLTMDKLYACEVTRTVDLMLMAGTLVARLKETHDDEYKWRSAELNLIKKDQEINTLDGSYEPYCHYRLRDSD